MYKKFTHEIKGILRTFEPETIKEIKKNIEPQQKLSGYYKPGL